MARTVLLVIVAAWSCMGVTWLAGRAQERRRQHRGRTLDGRRAKLEKSDGDGGWEVVAEGKLRVHGGLIELRSEEALDG